MAYHMTISDMDAAMIELFPPAQGIYKYILD